MNSELSSGVYLDTLFDQDLSWAQAGDSVEVSEESVSAIKPQIEEVGCAVPLSKKSYVDFVQQLVGEIKDRHQNSEVDRCRVAECDGEIEEWS